MIHVLFRNFLKALPSKLSALHKADPAGFWRKCLFCSFWLSIALFPAGYGLREVMPLLCLVFLLPYYHYAWPDCTLACLNVRWLFVCAGLMVVIGVVFSTSPLSSLLHAGTGINKAYILPFIAMECAASLQDLKRLVWASVFACFWEGLDGLWQAYTGHDFIMGYKPNNGRLTGSLGDYTVGNYLALALVPAFGVWYILREKLGAIASLFLCLALFWGPFFLFQGASSRSAVLAVGGALGLWALLRHGVGWRIVALPVTVVAGFMLFQGMRFSPMQVVNDNRWDLWGLGWRVFMEHPWFGAGAGQYNAVFRSLGLAPEREVITISHPHNLYLDMLYAHGIVGFGLGMTFICGFLIWGWRNIRPRLRAGGSSCRLYWTLAAWFWLGFAAWLLNGIFGHDFYRIWWLALAMCNMGIMIGAVVNGRKIESCTISGGDESGSGKINMPHAR